MNNLKKIILVEDDEYDADMTKEALAKIPIANEILWLETGQDFLDYLEQDGLKDIAVVIMDLNMPLVTGLEALEVIRDKNYPDFPVVVLSSSREHPDITRAYELGANSFIIKPVAPEEFQKAITTLGLYWGILNVPPPN